MQPNDFSLDYGFSPSNSSSPQDFSSDYGVSGESKVSFQMPQDVRNAEEVTGTHDLDGWCEHAVEQWDNLPNMGRTANEAWQNWSSQGKAYQNIDQAPVGSLIYFAPDQSNRGAGHVAISLGKGNMISATYQGVRQDNVNDWMTRTGQQPLGFVVP